MFHLHNYMTQENDYKFWVDWYLEYLEVSDRCLVEDTTPAFLYWERGIHEKLVRRADNLVRILNTCCDLFWHGAYCSNMERRTTEINFLTQFCRQIPAISYVVVPPYRPVCPWVTGTLCYRARCMMGLDVCLPAVVMLLAPLVNLRIVNLWHPYHPHAPPPPHLHLDLRPCLNVSFLARGTTREYHDRMTRRTLGFNRGEVREKFAQDT
jgi:hypothetical protein